MLKSIAVYHKLGFMEHIHFSWSYNKTNTSMGTNKWSIRH